MKENEAIEILRNRYDDLKKQVIQALICVQNEESALKIAISALEEIQQYRSIGTVEECWEAMERQRAKKPIKYGDTRQGLDNDGNSISKQEDCYECPTCESFLGYVSDCKDEYYQDSYCRCCGQSIDWSDNP